MGATNMQHVWPRTLIRPEGLPKLVYLDLNHWIALAKAASGQCKQHTDTLAACLKSVENQRALFPISDCTFKEIAKNRNHRQRRDLRMAIESLSRYFVVTSREMIATREIEAVLDIIVGPAPDPINAIHYLDWGVCRAFGLVGGLKIMSSRGEDVTAEFRESYADGPEAFDRYVQEAELNLNRQMIEGPTPSEEPVWRKEGWAPERPLEIYEQKSIDELEQVERFDVDPKWPRNRIRDAISARECLFEINTILKSACNKRRVFSLESIFPETEDARRAFDSMPSFDVSVTLKTSYHHNRYHPWKQNDIHDINAMASTVPYCDIVVTDKAVSSHLIRTGLDKRFNTIVLANLSELHSHL